MKALALASFALFAVACTPSEGVCNDFAAGIGTGTTLSFGGCWDQQDRQVVCTPSTPGHYQCSCSVGGNLGQSFERTEILATSTPPTEAELAPVNAGCGWSLRPR